MATNLQIDDRLLNAARKIGGLKTKKATVTLALEEFIRRRKRRAIWKFEGAVEYHDDYDYKAQRRAR